MLNLLKVLTNAKNITSSQETLEESRFEPKFFTRKRKMSFQEIVMFILGGIHTSTQSALNRFFTKHLDAEKVMSQQALSKARNHFNHTPFEKMFRSCVEMRYCGEHEIKTLYGYHVLAVDGSDIALPDMPGLLEEFGGTGRNADSPTAKASVLYDVLNDFLLDAVLEKANTSERELAVAHMKKLCSIAPEIKKLVIFDRGYPSLQFIEELSAYGFQFLMRVKTKWNLEADALLKDGLVELSNGSTIRVVKFQLPSGEEETLLTTLFDLPHEAFMELYFKRWPIETKYDIVKNKLALENFSGYSKNVILQDFWACMHLVNMVAVAKDEANAEIHAKRAKKENKYTYVANINQIIASLKEYWVAMYFANSSERDRLQDIVEREIRRSVVPIRPGRSVKRSSNPRNAKFHHNRKI
jgi:hypothetical protein